MNETERRQALMETIQSQIDELERKKKEELMEVQKGCTGHILPEMVSLKSAHVNELYDARIQELKDELKMI